MNSEPHNLLFKNINRKIRNLIININMDIITISSYMEDNDEYVSELHYYILALEDRNFFRHCGVDFKAILREFKNMLIGKKYGGASTIDMQLVRTITDYRERTISRKIYEMTLAILLNFKFSKKQILNCYMRNAFLGSHIIGFEAAIRKRFKDKPVLSELEMASLAAMLLKPMPLTPTKEWFCANESRARYAQKVRVFVKESK